MAGTRRAVVGCVAAFLAGALLAVGGCGGDAGKGRPAEFTNSIGMKFRLIAPGTFMMGSEKGTWDERPVHQVTITKPFYLGVYEVTHAQYQQVTGTDPSRFHPASEEGANRPVEYISWDEAREFCRSLSEKEGIEYRLPTEAEWEYACRAGTATEWSSGDSPAALGQCAWFEDNADRETHDVGQLEPNAWGLHDMHGNVWEWCQDWFGRYEPEAQSDPAGPAAATPQMRVLRGGSWGTPADDCRSAYRFRYAPVVRSSDLGFRVARSLP